MFEARLSIGICMLNVYRSRLKNLEAETPKEDKPGETYNPVDTWPSSGAVDIDDVTVAYK